MDPLDEALMSKEAFGWGNLAGEAGHAAAGALGAAAVSGAIAGARKLFAAGEKRREFTAMMDTNPDLVEAQRSNPKFFNASYNSVRSLNPSYGSDPIVAGSLMRRMMQSPESAGTILMSTMKAPPPGGSPFGLEVSGGGKPGSLKFKQEF